MLQATISPEGGEAQRAEVGDQILALENRRPVTTAYRARALRPIRNHDRAKRIFGAHVRIGDRLPNRRLAMFHRAEARQRRPPLERGRRLSVLFEQFVERTASHGVGKRSEHIVHDGENRRPTDADFTEVNALLRPSGDPEARRRVVLALSYPRA